MTEVNAAARGFVLTGGGSSRMGRDKARLPFRGRTLIEWVAGQVREAAGSVTLVGAPERYADLGLEAIAEAHAGLGPLSGIEAALGHSEADLNLIVACDMPHLNVADLRGLIASAAAWDADVCATAGGPDGAEPLCAVYHRRCLADVQQALGEGRLKVFELYAGWKVRLWEPADPNLATNINDLEDWRRLAG
ncbi:MAG TPA: molybdenum cofactor guanylyltransferase [Bryobacteraceae bacterium]|nr:molybdenum cofactor guanylyltransferase [Bryobacteraceae bacterium]